MLNQIVIAGNLGQNPEIFHSKNGNQIASFSLCCNISKEKTIWLKVVCFGKLAELAKKFLSKSSKVAVSGALDFEEWEKNGEKKSTYKIIANNLEFLTIKQSPSNEGGKDSDDDLPY